MARQDRCLRLLDRIDDNDIEGVKEVLRNDVDLSVDRKGDTPMHAASRKGSLDILKLMIANGGDVNLKNQNGYTPIHYAARDGRMDIVNYFLKCGADPNIQNKDGDAPMHELVKVQPMDVIEDMIKLGMNVNLRNKMGRTPLHVATRSNRHEATETLLTCGAAGNIKDKNGQTAEEICTDPELANRMKLHDILMEAMRKGTVKAQGVSLKNTNIAVELKRIGITIESSEIPSVTPASFYCRREKSENTKIVIPSENGDEMVSDMFYFKMADVPRACHVTLTVPIYGSPTETEELFVRFKNGKKEIVEKQNKSNVESICKFTVELIPEIFTICALYTCVKTDEQIVGKGGATVTTELDEDLKIKIPPDTFDADTKLSIKVFPNNEPNDNKAGMLLTNVYDIQADTGETVNYNNKSMTLSLPTNGRIMKPEDVVMLTLNEIADDTNEDCIEVVDSVVKVEGKTFVYDIPHFSIHVAVPRESYSAERSKIYKRLVSATERQRTAVFFAVVRNGQEQTSSSSLVVVECCLAVKATQRLAKWNKKGYESQSPEMSGSFMLKPYQEFEIMFKGAQPVDAAVKRKIAFLPRRPSYQPYRMSQEDYTTREGNVYICVLHEDLRDEHTDTECMAAIPFKIPEPPNMKHKEEVHPKETSQKVEAAAKPVNKDIRKRPRKPFIYPD